MKTQIYLVRHGQTDWNRDKKIQGWSDIPLNQSGIDEAEQLALSMRTLSIHAVYSSPLLRAYRTAEIISRHHGLPITPLDSLKEAGFGRFEGFTWEQLMVHPLVVNRSQVIDRYHDHTGEGESIHDVYLRTSAAIDSLVSKHRQEAILIVSHALAIKTIAYHAGVIEKNQIEHVEIKNAQLYHLAYNHSTDDFEIADFPIVRRS
ncbi:histidine phosphatase family protein [Candidatus Roizmanbacteria bacterium]|nr:histidine phosphatase family protein [Candidatus Roizmanbacteria bacterium]